MCIDGNLVHFIHTDDMPFERTGKMRVEEKILFVKNYLFIKGNIGEERNRILHLTQIINSGNLFNINKNVILIDASMR